MREYFLAERLVKSWSSLLREVVGSLSLRVFKGPLDVALRDMSRVVLAVLG